jgi:(S)-2-hydroxyglutarate dehydrogenase
VVKVSGSGATTAPASKADAALAKPLDVTVVGGGILGLAVAYQLLVTRPALRVAVIEKEDDVGLHQTGRNSGVVHSGIYYRPGSLKARLCLEGRAELERFAQEHAIPFRRPGKLLVAVDQRELSWLEALRERGTANGIRGVGELGPAEIRDLEPHVVGLRALTVPTTAVTDFRLVASALASEVRAREGRLHLGVEVLEVRAGWGEWAIQTSRGRIGSRLLVNCAGLFADRVASMADARIGERILPVKGSYRSLVGDGSRLVKGLVYPVPDPSLPFLGIHLTRGVDDAVLAGPTNVLAWTREAYRRWPPHPVEVARTLTGRNFLRFCSRRLGSGLRDLLRDPSDAAFLRSCRRFVPEIEASHLGPGPVGVRAQAVSRAGKLLDDFRIVERPGSVHLVNAPSPAATSSLAIGKMIASMCSRALGDG